jgi:V/A-type H+-transporting ATPase subunit K
VKQRFILRSIQVGVVLFAASLVVGIVVSAAMANNDEPQSRPAEGAKAQADKVVYKGEDHRDILMAKVFAAGATMGLSILAAAYAVGKVGAAALGAASEKPELLNRALVFVALGEGLAILGLVVALMILGAQPPV